MITLKDSVEVEATPEEGGGRIASLRRLREKELLRVAGADLRSDDEPL